MFHIDRRSHQSAKSQLADQIKEKIESGEYRPGTAIPSEKRIEQDTGLSRSTIREGIGILRNLGMLYVAQEGQRRTVVAERVEGVILHSGDKVITEGDSRVFRVDGTTERCPPTTMVVE